MGETGIGTYIAYGFIITFLVVLAVLMLRLMVLFSLLWIEPLLAMVRRMPLIGRLTKR